MNFGKLLASGKSMISGQGVKAYRENKHVYLPKFEAKNPFSKAVPASTAAIPALPATAAAPVAPAPAARPKADFVLTKPMARPAPAPAPSSSWAAKLNPIAMFRGPSASAFKPVATVQTELSLDSVKVVHNDLSDSEVEIVPIKSRPAEAAPAETAASWKDMGEKVFGANVV
jgi:hypothetical protein